MPPKTKPADDATMAAPTVSAAAVTPPDEIVESEAVKVSDLFSIHCIRPQGLWRAGRFWPPEKTSANVTDFTAQQLDALLAEPLLVVTFAQE